MDKTMVKYIDEDYVKRIESLKSDIKYIYFSFFLLVILIIMFFLLYHFQNRRLVNVELKLEIYGEPKKDFPLMCGL